MKSTRGEITIALLLLLGAMGGFTLAGWKPLYGLFGKKPPVQQLTELQAKLDAQQQAAVQAAKDAEAVKVAERLKLEGQIRLAQGDALGAELALKKAPPTPEIRLAQRMTQRVTLKLATAIGALPPEQREAMVELIEQALSDKQWEVDAANAKLAALDEQFKATTKARDALQQQIPVLEEQARRMAEKAAETQGLVTVKTNEVKTWAEKTQAALAENGSLWSNIKRGVLFLGVVYAFLAFGLPAIVKHLATGNPLKSVLRDVSGYTLNPLMHLDAKHKIAEALYTPVPPDKPTP